MAGRPVRMRAALRQDRGCLAPQKIEQLADLVAVLGRMAHRDVGVHGIAVAPSDPRPRHVARLHEVGDDALRSALGDPHRRGDVAQANVRIAAEAEEDLAMAGEEVPILRIRT
jgi:hypothetical protein